MYLLQRVSWQFTALKWTHFDCFICHRASSSSSSYSSSQHYAPVGAEPASEYFYAHLHSYWLRDFFAIFPFMATQGSQIFTQISSEWLCFVAADVTTSFISLPNVLSMNTSKFCFSWIPFGILGIMLSLNSSDILKSIPPFKESQEKKTSICPSKNSFNVSCKNYISNTLITPSTCPLRSPVYNLKHFPGVSSEMLLWISRIPLISCTQFFRYCLDYLKDLLIHWRNPWILKKLTNGTDFYRNSSF